MKISQLTRRDIIDALTTENVCWHGRLDDTAFLGRLFDLKSLPSKDSRFPHAEGDIWQHRINNDDWENDWVFHDDRFNLMWCDDEVFLRFLCETLHPIVRNDAIEAERLHQLYNEYLRNDGFGLVERGKISGRPTYTARDIGAAVVPVISTAKGISFVLDRNYVFQQITRMEAAIEPNPDLAIGTAKELVETCCRTILEERGNSAHHNLEVPQLVKLTCKELQLTPDDIADSAAAADIIKRLLSNLATITQGVAELRNKYGTGHGKAANAKGLQPRHAKLAVGAASTLAIFLVETHEARKPI